MPPLLHSPFLFLVLPFYCCEIPFWGQTTWLLSIILWFCPQKELQSLNKRVDLGVGAYSGSVRCKCTLAIIPPAAPTHAPVFARVRWGISYLVYGVCMHVVCLSCVCLCVCFLLLFVVCFFVFCSFRFFVYFFRIFFCSSWPTHIYCCTSEDVIPSIYFSGNYFELAHVYRRMKWIHVLSHFLGVYPPTASLSGRHAFWV